MFNTCSGNFADWTLDIRRSTLWKWKMLLHDRSSLVTLRAIDMELLKFFQWVFLRRMVTFCRIYDIEFMFGKNRSHISEIFQEKLEFFMELWEDHVLGTLNVRLIYPQLEIYADEIKRKAEALDNFINMIDGAVIGISRLRDEVIKIIE